MSAYLKWLRRQESRARPRPDSASNSVSSFTPAPAKKPALFQREALGTTDQLPQETTSSRSAPASTCTMQPTSAPSSFVDVSTIMGEQTAKATSMPVDTTQDTVQSELNMSHKQRSSQSGSSSNWSQQATQSPFKSTSNSSQASAEKAQQSKASSPSPALASAAAPKTSNLFPPDSVSSTNFTVTGEKSKPSPVEPTTTTQIASKPSVRPSEPKSVSNKNIMRSWSAEKSPKSKPPIQVSDKSRKYASWLRGTVGSKYKRAATTSSPSKEKTGSTLARPPVSITVKSPTPQEVSFSARTDATTPVNAADAAPTITESPAATSSRSDDQTKASQPTKKTNEEDASTTVSKHPDVTDEEVQRQSHEGELEAREEDLDVEEMSEQIIQETGKNDYEMYNRWKQQGPQKRKVESVASTKSFVASKAAKITATTPITQDRLSNTRQPLESSIVGMNLSTTSTMEPVLMESKFWQTLDRFADLQ